MLRKQLYFRILGALFCALLATGLPVKSATAQSGIVIPPDPLYSNWPDPIHSLPPLDAGFINNIASICQGIPGFICPGFPPIPPPPCDCLCACSLCDQLITVAYTQLLHEALRLLYFGTPDPIDGNPDMYNGGPSQPGLFAGNSFLGVPSRLAMHQSFLTGTIFIGKVFLPTTQNPKSFSTAPYHIAKGIGADIAGPSYTGDTTGIGILPAMMWMTEDLTKNMMHQTFMIGAFIDAKNQLETQLLFQELTADAHRDYHSDIEMCTIGGATRGLAASHFNSRATTAILSQRATDRWLGSRNTEAAEGGRDADRRNRIAQFAERYCNAYENNPSFNSGTRVPPTGLGLVCEAGSPDPELVNKDIDYYRNLWQQKTLDINFGDGTQTDDEIDILALAANLYSHEVYDQPTKAMLQVEENRDEYLDLRASLAKRSVAQNSFNALVGLKSAGVPSSSPSMQYLSFILKELGLPDDLVFTILGENPSYFAQLQFLSKQIYQRPEFYISLYTSPTNVERRNVALQAISSILERDIYESHLRSEAIMSVLLEMKLIPEQGAVQNILNGLKGQTR